MRIVFLGTTAGVPTAERGHSAIAIKYSGETLLFDCGEGTQRQLIKAKISFMKITKIFISHFHADHFLGLPGLIQSMSFLGRKNPLVVYGPDGTKTLVESLLKLGYYTLQFLVEAKELKPDGVVEGNNYRILTHSSDHLVPTLAYCFQEKERPGKFDVAKASKLGIPPGPMFRKLQLGHTITTKNGKIVKPEEIIGPPQEGRKIVYISDSRPSHSIIKFANGADILIHEATFADDLNNRAYETGHSTVSGAAEIAKQAQVKQLILTHISPRYEEPDLEKFQLQARKIFENTIIAKDLMIVELTPRKEINIIT